MALDLNELSRIKNDISNNSEELNSLLRDFNNLIKDNIGNVETWDSAKASDFLNDWNNFSDEKFPVFKQSFTSQINILDGAIKSYQEAEGTTTRISSTSTQSTTPYEQKIEKLSENTDKPKIINEETTKKAIDENLQNNKDLSNMFNQELYKGLKGTLVSAGIVAGATRIDD